jgi:Flp pilus assembly protein TadG
MATTAVEKLEKRGRRSLRAFAGSRRGNISVIGAVTILPLTLLAGGATDYARARQVQAELQTAMDAAVLSGAKSGNSATVAAASFHTRLNSQITIDPPVFGTRADGRFTGTVRAQSPNAFLSLASLPFLTVRASSVVAVRIPPNDVCLTARDGAGSGFSSAGGAQTLASTCRFDVRSTGSPAASFLGTGSVNTKQLCVKGANVAQNGSTVTGLELSCVMSKPYAAEPRHPAVGACTLANTNLTFSGGGSIPPGTYCGATTIQGGGTTTLQTNGVYVFRGVSSATPGHLWVRGPGTLRGEGVFLYFADATTMTLEGTGEMRLTAPTSGDYQGVLFHEAAGLPQSQIRITRGGTGFMRGVINLPSRNLFVASSGTTTTDEVTLVVNRFTIEGAGSWSFRSAPPSVADRLSREPYLTE